MTWVLQPRTSTRRSFTFPYLFNNHLSFKIIIEPTRKCAAEKCGDSSLQHLIYDL